MSSQGDDWSDDNASGWGSDGDWADDDGSVDDAIPRDARQRVQRDVEELTMIEPFIASKVLFGRAQTIGVRIGFPLDALNLNAEQARAWSLPSTGYLLIDISTPCYYFDTIDRSQIKVSLGLASDLELQNDQPPLQKCKATWPLLKALQKNVMSVLGTAAKPGFELADARLVMDSCECSLLTAVCALRKFNDATVAIDQITSKRFQRSGSSPSGPSSYHSWAKRSAEEKSRSVAIQKLDKAGVKRSMVMEACGVTDHVARQAIRACDGDVQAAIMLLVAAGDEADGQDFDESKEVNETISMTDSIDWCSSPVLCGSVLVPEELIDSFAGYNFLVRIAAFVLGRLTILSSLCMMCEKSLNHVGLNLTICSDDLCRMSYEKMGVGFDLASQIKSSPILTDFYLSMLYVAANSSHIPFAFPKDVSVADKDNVEHSLQTPLQTEDYARLQLALSKIPAVDQLIAWIDSGELYQQCDQLDLLIIPLLRWLFQSNPSFLRELAPHESLKSVNTPHQFILLMSSPEKEAQFQARKAALPYGTIYCWHGSSLKNWHSIMRVGLKNLSNTSLRAHGAMYGAGIYLAPDSHTSRGYCGQSSGWHHSRFGTNVTALALCEVISLPTFNPHLVIPDESICTTRYLFLFEGSVGLEQTIQAKSLIHQMHPSLRNFNPTSAIHAHRNSGSALHHR